MTLSDHLSACKRETGLRVGSFGPCVRAFYKAVNNDKVLAKQARELHASISPDVMQRDHISRWTKELLERALVGVA